MTEEDKILINAYFDNEASVDEIKYVELLFSKDEDALKYSNAIKLSNNQIENFFTSDEISMLKNNLDDFTKNIQDTSKVNNSITKHLSNIINSLSGMRLISSFAAVFLFSIIIVPLFDNEEIDALYEFKIPIERSEGTISIDNLVEETVFKMKDLSLNKSKLIIEDSNIVIIITKEDENCIFGNATLIESAKTREFKYCSD